MEHDPVSALAHATGKSYVEAPAGYGKTELIARALALCPTRQLVLTHTHAGVDSIRKRLKVVGVPTGKHRVETIDAFCVRFANGYPVTADILSVDIDSNSYWDEMKSGAANVFQLREVQRLFSDQYAGVIVDEYQDCSKLQHRIIESIANELPLRLLGDPMQSLLSWKGQDPINWKSQIIDCGYYQLPSLTEPQRWLQVGASEDLGKWIARARTALQSSMAATYDSTVQVAHVGKDQVSREILSRVYALKKLGIAGESVVVIHQKYRRSKKGECRPDLQTQDPFATVLSGEHFSVLMEIEGKLLKSWCEEFAKHSGPSLALSLLEFSNVCCSKKTDELKPIVSALALGMTPANKSTKGATLVEFLQSCDGTFGVAEAQRWLGLLGRFDGRKIHHRELFYGMCQVLRLCESNSNLTLSEGARKVRELESHRGRTSDSRIIARPILIKGLQFDHVIVACPEEMTACEQYVAFSRAVKSLHVVSTDPTKIKGVPSRASAVLRVKKQEADMSGVQQASLFDNELPL
jgi:superfamily I DNA/RNA helicase